MDHWVERGCILKGRDLCYLLKQSFKCFLSPLSAKLLLPQALTTIQFLEVMAELLSLQDLESSQSQ